MPYYDILIPEEYETQGQKKTAFHKVGSAFDAKNGSGFNCEILAGVAVTGRFIVRPRQAQQQRPAGQGRQEQPMNDELQV